MEKQCKTFIKKAIHAGGNRGMTLLETVMAVTIFGLSIAGMVRLFSQAKMLTDSTRDRYVAANLAKNQMERLGSINFSILYDMGLSNGVPDEEIDETGNPSDNDSQNRFRRTTTITNRASNLVEIIVRVDIKSRYKDLFLTNHSEEMRTYFAQQRVDTP